jgi:hypothetical protein
LPADGETGWGTAYRTSMQTIDAAIASAGIPRSYLAGLSLVNNGARKIDFQAGVCKGNDQSTVISLPAMLTKDLNASWAVGNGNGGLFNAGIAINTWYHCFAILRTDTGVVDCMFSVDATGATIPSPYTIFRRLGSVKTDGASNIYTFTQYGDLFEWNTMKQDYTSSPGVNTALSVPLTVPPGISVRAWVNLILNNATTAINSIYLSDLATTDSAPDRTGFCSLASGVSGWNSGDFYVQTDVNRAIRARLETGGVADLMRILTKGWLDRRGKDV